jgi:hypothetical protein
METFVQAEFLDLVSEVRMKGGEVWEGGKEGGIL